LDLHRTSSFRQTSSTISPDDIMGSYHAHAPWRKAVLIPFWTIQLLVGLLDLALLGLAVGIIVNWEHNNDDCADTFDCNYNDNVSTEAKMYVHLPVYPLAPANECDSVVPIWMVMLVICLVLTITEIVLLARHKLKPKTFVIFNTIKSTIWTILFILDIVSFVDNNSRTTSFIGLIIEALLWYALSFRRTNQTTITNLKLHRLCFIIPLIYGSVIYRRTRRSTTYAPVIDPLSNPSNISNLPEFEIPSTYTGYNAKAYASTDIESQPTTRIPGERRASYNHQRDTRFEAFRRTSYGNETSAYKPYAPESVGYTGTIPTGGLGSGRGSPEIPQVFVQHHDGEAFEMESNSRTGLR
jgi:hypothetical protein